MVGNTNDNLFVSKDGKIKTIRLIRDMSVGDSEKNYSFEIISESADGEHKLIDSLVGRKISIEVKIIKKEIKNTTVFNRIAKDQKNAYLKISKSLINDDRLTATELAVLIKILKNNDNYVFNKNYVQKKSKIGRDKFNACIKHLKQLGYLDSKKIQSGYAWTVNEIPISKSLAL